MGIASLNPSYESGQTGVASGRQAFAQPGRLLQPVIEPVMQPARTALPELETLGQQAVAAPVFGTVRGLIEKTPLGVGQQAFQLGAVGDHLALGRGPGAQTAAQRTHLEVSAGLLEADLLDR